MSVEIIRNSDIFQSDAQTLVNTVNCVGAMGKGIAKRYKKNYPEIYQKYIELCQEGLLDIGKLWLCKTEQKWILNFPTKTHWRYPSEISYLQRGLEKFMLTYKTKGIKSIAFPLLGANNGGIPPEQSLKVMTQYLSKCEIPVYIYLTEKDLQIKYQDLKFGFG